ncbi:MAG: HypC/HybG/HupF family hydrogenase formation chaperone [Gaiellaceae bacterium]
MSCTADTHCITCSDEGVPMRVVAAPEDGIARCEADGAESEVMIDLVAPVTTGDRLLVHAGVALVRLA